MMTAIRINKMGKTFATRQAARDWANENGGQVLDMSKRDAGFVEGQMLCNKYHVTNTSPRWVVLFNRIICRPVTTKMIDKPFDRLGKTVVINKKRYQGMLLTGKRLGRIL